MRQAAAEALSAYGLLAEPAIPALKKAAERSATKTSSAKPAGRSSASRDEAEVIVSRSKCRSYQEVRRAA